MTRLHKLLSKREFGKAAGNEYINQKDNSTDVSNISEQDEKWDAIAPIITSVIQRSVNFPSAVETLSDLNTTSPSTKYADATLHEYLQEREK